MRSNILPLTSLHKDSQLDIDNQWVARIVTPYG
jgi:hypothetical protein